MGAPDGQIMGGGPGQRPHVGIVPIPSLWRMEKDRVVGQQEIHLSSNGFFDHRLGGIDGEHHSTDDLVIPAKLPANWIPRFCQMQGKEFFEPVFHISQSHGPRIRGLRLGLTTMIKRLCSLLALWTLSGCASSGQLFPDRASRNQFDTWLQLQGEARRGERVDEFGKPETDLRARLQR